MNNVAARHGAREKQYQPSNRSFSNGRSSFKNKAFTGKEQRDNWYYSQAGVKLLKILQHTDGVIVTLLRFTSSARPFTTVTSWKLPFKLNNLRAYLMYPYLQEEEKANEQLLGFLASFGTQQKKFEILMEHRITGIVKALTTDTNTYETRITEISSEHDWSQRLCDEYDPKFKPNVFVEDFLKKNNIKVKF